MNSGDFEARFWRRFLTRIRAERALSMYFTELTVVNRDSSQNPLETIARIDHPNHPRPTSNPRQGRAGTTPSALGNGETRGIRGC